MSVVRIFLVEDNSADVVLFEEAVRESQTPAEVRVAGDGEEAMRFLRSWAAGSEAFHPDVVVLDLNLPRVSGQEVLAAMAGDPALAGVPGAVLTTSTSEQRVCDLFAPGHCRYFVKTDSFDGLQETVRKIAAHARRR